MRLIDADALLKSYDVAWMVEYDETGCGVRKKAIPAKTVEDAPTIDAVPVAHAEWSNPFIGGYDGLHAVYYMTCSKCMKEVRHSIFRYCPMCGAKMDGGASDE